MAKVSKKFVDETLWPEFQEISETLRTYLSEVTDRVVSEVIHQDSSEAEVVEEPSHEFLCTLVAQAQNAFMLLYSVAAKTLQFFFTKE